MNKEKVELRKVRDFGDIIGDALLFIGQNIKPLGKALLVFCGPFIFAGIISALYTNSQIADIKAGMYDDDVRFKENLWEYNQQLKTILKVLFYWLIYISLQTTICSYVAVYQEKNKQTPTLNDVWEFYKHYFFKFFLYSIVVVIFMIICFVFFIIPGFYVAPAMSLIFPIMLLGNESFDGAFSRSFDLIKGNWLFSFGVLLITGIMVGLMGLVAQLPSIASVVVNLLTHNDIKPHVFSLIAVMEGVSQLLNVITMMVGIVLFYHLEEKLDGVGLLHKIRNFGKKAQLVNEDE